MVRENAWSHLNHGLHICSIFSNEREQFMPLVPFFNDGARRHERCIYVHGKNTPEHVSKWLLPRHAKKSSVAMVPAADAYTRGGSFEPDATLAHFGETVAHSEREGYSAVRVAGEMDWIVSYAAPREKVIEYETKLNSFIPARKLIGVCLFEETLFDEPFLIDMLLTHPYLILHGKMYENRYFYIDPVYGSDMISKMKLHTYQQLVDGITDETPLAELVD